MLATRQLRVKVLGGTAVLCWLLGLSPLGKLPKGVFLMLGFGCGLQLIQEAEGLIYDEAIAKINKTLNHGLDAKTLALQTHAAEQELQAQFGGQQPTYSPEVLDELRESLEHLVREEIANATPELSTSESDQKSLYLAVVALLEAGKPETFIIEKILKLGGDNWSLGKQRLQQLLDQGTQNEW